MTPTIIVDGKNSQGKRMSISVDEALWSIFIASRNFSSQQARRDIKARMRSDLIENTYEAKRWIYTQIARPNLLPKKLAVSVADEP